MLFIANCRAQTFAPADFQHLAKNSKLGLHIKLVVERSRLKSFTASYIFHINDFKIFKNINIKFYTTSCSTQLHLHQSKHSNSQGCVTALFDWFDDKMLLFVGTVSTVLVFQVIFTFLLACFSLACPICPGISPVHSPQFKYSIFIS